MGLVEARRLHSVELDERGVRLRNRLHGDELYDAGRRGLSGDPIRWAASRVSPVRSRHPVTLDLDSETLDLRPVALGLRSDALGLRTDTLGLRLDTLGLQPDAVDLLSVAFGLRLDALDLRSVALDLRPVEFNLRPIALDRNHDAVCLRSVALDRDEDTLDVRLGRQMSIATFETAETLFPTAVLYVRRIR